MANKLRQGTHGVPLFVASVALAVTALAWTTAVRVSENRDEARFKNAVEQAQQAIKDRMDRQTALLESTKGFVMGQPLVTRENFHLFVKSLNLPTTYPGSTGVGWSVVVPPGSEEQIFERMRMEGRNQFQFHALGPSEERHAILFLEPEDQMNLRAIGLNMYSEATRRHAMETARSTGAAVTSGKVRLVQEGREGDQPGFLIYLPVYQTVATPETLEQKYATFRGFVYSPFRAHDLLSNVLHSQTEPIVSFEVFDGESLDEADRLFGEPPALHVDHTDHSVLQIPGRTWTVRFSSTPAFEEQSSESFVIWIPVIGGLVTILLTALTWRQARITSELQNHALELQRREFSQRLLAESGTLLGQSLDYKRTLTALAELAVPHFADWCAVDLLGEDGKAQRLAVAHIKPEKIKWARELQERYPSDPDAPYGLPEVLRSGEPELYEHISEEMLERGAIDDEHRKIIAEIGFSSAMIVPIRSRGRTLGAITYVWAESKKHYDKEDLQLAMEIASRAGLALDNALLFFESERDRAEVERINRELEDIVFERTAELRATNQELEAFAYSVSHDLRAPLRGIDGFSRSLKEDYGDILDDTAHDYIARIRAGAKRMDELISAMLGLSRITRAEVVRRPIDITAMAEDAAKNAKAQFGDHAEIAVQPGMTAEGDEHMLHAVFDNLIGNAVKFTSKVPEAKIEIGQEEDVFFVRDNGVGFNPAYAGKLFAPFERLHSPNEYKGSGIGLASVERIIKRHGGQIWAEGAEGKGAIFYFTLP